MAPGNYEHFELRGRWLTPCSAGEPRARGAIVNIRMGWGAVSAQVVVLVSGCAVEVEEEIDVGAVQRASLAHSVEFPNPHGINASYSTAGPIDTSPANPFFAPFGLNDRTCGSCHVPSAGWSITPAEVQARFEATAGLDPIFRPVDGANSPALDVSTEEARREAYSLLLEKGLIRVGIGIPDGAEFELVAVDDPYGHATADQLSLFRRPLPTANLKFLSAVMWDGRESAPLVDGTQTHDMLLADLGVQSNSATRGHAEAAADLTPTQREAIVAFEMTIFSAQIEDAAAGRLDDGDTSGGPGHLVDEPTYFGINDVLGADPTGAAFDPLVFRNYDTWAAVKGKRKAARQAIARGQQIFNTAAFEISGVRGVNDVLGVEALTGTCTTCHDTPNAGNHSTRLPLDLGLTDAERRTPDMPLYTLRHKVTGEEIQTTDPGLALVTGRWDHVALFKGPILRGLAARPPYFHDGSAYSLEEVVAFYDERFSIGLTSQQKADLAAFLACL